VSGFLRFVGLLNAAVWCGSAISLAFCLPALFSPQLKHLLTDAGVGFAAESILSRYFILQYWCGAIALAHLFAEWLYFGKPLLRLNLILIATVLFLGLVGGLGIQPKMRAWHVAKYFGRTPAQQLQAAKSFAAWHAASEVANLIVIGELIIYLWRISDEQKARFVRFNKIRN
jgi:hypothetical protein